MRALPALGGQGSGVQRPSGQLDQRVGTAARRRPGVPRLVTTRAAHTAVADGADGGRTVVVGTARAAGGPGGRERVECRPQHRGGLGVQRAADPGGARPGIGQPQLPHVGRILLLTRLRVLIGQLGDQERAQPGQFRRVEHLGLGEQERLRLPDHRRRGTRG